MAYYTDLQFCSEIFEDYELIAKPKEINSCGEEAFKKRTENEFEFIAKEGSFLLCKIDPTLGP